MPAPDAIILYGDVPESTLVDEPNLLVNSITLSAAREKREYKGGAGNVLGLQYRNPLLTIAFNATVSVAAGLAIAHPGDEIAELANFASTTHGFDPSVGILVLEDPSTEMSQDNANTVSGTVIHYPFMTA